MFESIWSGITNAVGELLDGIIEKLPLSPFNAIMGKVAIDDGILGFIAWLVPFPEMIAFLEVWGIAIGIYYLWMIIARWIKLLE